MNYYSSNNAYIPSSFSMNTEPTHYWQFFIWKIEVLHIMDIKMEFYYQMNATIYKVKGKESPTGVKRFFC